jgi:FkbM family methyltransferase
MSPNIKNTPYGLMLYNPLDKWIGESLLHYGEYSPVETRHLLALINEKSVVIDVGANIGCLTLALARKAKAVLAFEPQRLVFQMLCANLALNGITNVHTAPMALGAQPGVAQMNHKDQNCGGASLVEHGVETEEVQVSTIDSMTLPACDLIKIDVEGFEQQVLEGARQTLRRLRPILYVEADRNDKAADLIGTIKGMGYLPFWDITPLSWAKNFDKNPVDIFHNKVNINLLCLPRVLALPQAFLDSFPNDTLNFQPALDGDNFEKLKHRLYGEKAAA